MSENVKAKIKVDVENLDKVKEQVASLKSMIIAKAAEHDIQLDAKELEMVEIDWASLVRPEDKIDIKGEEYIKLAGLRRLARMRGYVLSSSRVIQAAEYQNMRNCTVEHTIQWSDGTVDCHAADASYRTINDGFKNFPTAMACNRAEARCIRAALGIEMCSHEEIGPESGDEDLSGPSNDQQRAAIEMLLTRRKISPDDSTELFGDTLTKKIVIDGKFVLDNITHQEAIKIMAALNKPKKK